MESSELNSFTISLPATTPKDKLPAVGHINVSLPNASLYSHISESSSSDFSDFEFDESETTSVGQFHPLPSTSNYAPSIPSDYCSSAKRETPPIGIKTVHGERQTYWKINFLVVFLPLIFCGLPIHILLGGRRGITGTKEWFKQLFFKDHIFARVLTIIFFIVGLGINGFFINIAGVLLYSLVINGEVRSSIFEDLLNILRIAPVVIPLDLMWIWGYSIRKLLLSFDRVKYPEIEVEWKVKPNKKTKKWKNGWRRMPSYRIRLLGVYVLVIFNQSVHALIIHERIKHWTDDAAILDAWISFALNFMYNLMLPIYICLAWAIQFEFERLSLYIKSLIACRIHPTLRYLSQFKRYYKAVGNHVVAINDICSGYYSWVLLYLFVSMYNEVYGVIQVIITSFINYMLGNVSNGTELPKVDVRLFVGNFFGGLSQVVLIVLTVWFCITANDQARNLHVRLNDFVSEPHVVLTPELYKKFRMLKYYIHSRMETEKPALLTIPIIGASPYCRALYSWKIAYRVRH